MKKQLYVAAAAAALVSVAPQQLVQAQTQPSASVQQQDAQLKAELTSLYQKVKELSTEFAEKKAIDDSKQNYYKQHATYFASLATGGNPAEIKTQLEAGTKMTLAQFKAQVEKDYIAARMNYFASVNSALSPDRVAQIDKLVKDLTKSTADIQKHAQTLLAEQKAAAAAEKKAKEEQAKVDAAKKQAIAEISQMKELPNSLKNKYLTKVKDATTIQEVDAAKQEAAQYVANRKQIEAKKAEAKKTLTTKHYLYPGERSDYLDRLENAGTEAEIDSLLTEADNTAAANKVIFEKREAINKEIDNLAYLSPAQKADFKGRLEEVQTVNQLNNGLLAAKKANIQALKDEEKEALKKAKAILKGIKQLPEVTDKNLYEGQMEIWKSVGGFLEEWLKPFDSLNPEKDANLTNKELSNRHDRLYDVLHYGEMEYIARDLNQKLQKFPNNQELRTLLKGMFHDSYASIETGGKTSDFVRFFNRDIAPRQKKFNDLYQRLTGKPSAPKPSAPKPANPGTKPSAPKPANPGTKPSAPKPAKPKAGAQATDTTVPVYRLYHPGLRVHLYTKDSNEKTVLSHRGWQYEGIAWKTETQKGKPVYRLYHPGLKVHLYTIDANEYKVLANRGWKQEGIAYRSYGDVKVYRLYHPGLKKHLYTKDANEYKVLGSRGWKQEGIAWYSR